MTGQPSVSLYQNPELAHWLDSFEGVPDNIGKPAAPADAVPVAQRPHATFEWLGIVAPGVTLALLIAIAGEWLSQWIGVTVLQFEKSPISAILLAIVLGLIIRNTLGVPGVYDKGLRLCVKKILRVGIALLGIRLSLLAAGRIGLVAVPIVLGCIAAALLIVSRITQWFGLPRRLGSLIAVGTAICGVSAIVATAPTIDAEEDEISYAVATITLFGMVALFTYPFIAPWLFHDDMAMTGLFLGTAIHDTSQVAGAGLMVQELRDAPAALNIAVVTKLVRNLCMVAVIPLMAILYHRGNDANGDRPKWTSMVPLFVLGFVAMTLVRTAGDSMTDSATWHDGVGLVKTIATWCLMLAMAAVGLGTNIKRIIGLGLRPFALGLCAALLVGVVSYVLVSIFGPMLS
jgi:uncharacterized integral membrane protein (TIGR00698 family)